MAFDPAKYGAKPVATSTQGFDPNKYGAKPVQKVSNSVMPQVTPSPTWSSGGKSFADIIPHSTYNPEYTGLGNIFKAVGNIPHEVATAVENVARVPKAIYDTVTDPNVKARGFLGGAKDFATSVYDVAGKPLTQGLSTLGNTLLGGLQAGVQATTGINIGDKNAEQAWNSKAENTYNLVQSIQRGLVENPLATAAMTAEGVRQVRGLPKGTDAVSSMARPVIDTTKIAASPVLQPISNTLSASAETSIVKSLAPTTKANKVTASRVASQALERPMGDTFAFTRQGLENKAIKGKEIAGQAIEDFGKLTGESKTSSIIDALEKEKAQYTAGGVVVNADAVGQLTKVQDIIRQYGDTIDNETLRGVRRIFDTEVKKSKGFAVPPSEGSLIEAKKIAADNIRGILAETNPDLAKLNKEYNFWANLEQVVRDTNQRTQGQVGIGKDIATLAGAASGNGITGMVLQGLTFRWLGSAIKSTGWRLVSARIKSSIADALASGDLAAVNDILSGISKNPTMLAEWSAMQSQMPSLRQTSISTIPTTKPISTVIPTSKPRTPSQSTDLSTATRQVVSSPKSTPAKASVANDPAIIRRLTRERGAVGTPSDEWLLASAKRELKKTPNDPKLQAFVAEKELMVEARKYKTAEEFVKAQQPIYHGTPAKFDKFDTSVSEGNATWFTADKRDIVNNTAGAVQPAGSRLNIMERYPKPNLKLATPEQADAMFTDQLIAQGYRGVKYPKGEYGDYEWTKLFNPNEDTITRAQLTSIYNRAHGITKPPRPVTGMMAGSSDLNGNDLAKEARKYKSAEEFVKAGMYSPARDSVARNEIRKVLAEITETRKASTLKENPNNPPIDKSTVRIRADDMREGKRPYIVVDGDMIIDGHHTYQAYLKEGIDDIPVVTKSQLTDIWNKANKGVLPTLKSAGK